MAQIRVAGLPKPQGSKRGFPVKRSNGKIGVALVESADEALKDWRYNVTVAAAALREPVIADHPMAVKIMFWLPRPKATSKKIVYTHKRPDLDKLVRAVLDSLTGVAYADDSQVAKMEVCKLYPFADGFIGATISWDPIRELV